MKEERTGAELNCIEDYRMMVYIGRYLKNELFDGQ